MAERRGQVYPLTADLAGVLAAAQAQPVRDQTGAGWRLGDAVVRGARWIVGHMPVSRRTVGTYQVRTRSV